MANLNTIKDVVMENKEIEELRWQLEKQRIAKQYWFSKYKELKKEIKELEKSHRRNIKEWVKGDKISYETINRLKAENGQRLLQVAQKHVELENVQKENKELKKENEELHKGWKLPEIEKIRNKRN